MDESTTPLRPQQDLPSRPARPTVESALQHTPLTSIVPFDADIIPFPSAFPASTASKILDEEEQNIASRQLRDLDALAKDPNAASSHLRQTLQQVQQYLTADDLTELKFKSPPLLQHRSSTVGQGGTDANGPRKSSESHIGSFSKMLLNNTDISYHRYPTPASVDSASAQGTNEPSTSPRKEARKQLTSTSVPGANRKTIDPSAHYDSDRGALLTPQRSINGQRSPSAAQAVVLQLPPSSDPKNYSHFPEIDDEILQSNDSGHRKRKREDSVDDVPLQISYDQQQRADEAVGHLLDLVQDKIFVAEDHLEPDTSGVVPDHASEIFMPSGSDESTTWILRSEIQARLDKFMQKVIKFDRFQGIPLEYLARLQKICSTTLRAAEGLDLTSPTDTTQDVEDAWAEKLDLADNALLASRCLLRIMVARSQDKELCSEEILQQVLNSLKHILEDCVIPTAEIHDASSGASRLETIIAQKKRLVGIMQHSGQVLNRLGELILRIDMSESILHTTEYLSTRLIFVENASTEKDSVLGLQSYHGLRKHAMDAVAKVFFRQPSQRQSIFNEILSSLEKLPVTRQSARQFKIIDGKPIQLVSALIMQLVQTSSTRSVESNFEKSANNGSSQDGSGSEDESSSGPHESFKHANGGSADQIGDPLYQLTTTSKTMSDTAQKNAAYVVKYLIERALKSTKSGDQPYRNLLDIFAEDFISVFGSTDWPAAEMLLRVLLSHLIGIVENDRSTAPAKTMALDLMGLMGSGIAELQSLLRRKSQMVEDADSKSRQSLHRLIGEALDGDGGAVHESEILDLEGPYREVFEYLHYRDFRDGDLHLRSAIAYYLSQWARNIQTSFDNARKQLDADEEDEIIHWDCTKVAKWLKRKILDQEDAFDTYGYDSVSTARAQMSYALTVLSMPFGKALGRILSILLKSLGSPQVTVRNRSLKSVIQVVESDSSILDRTDSIMSRIVPCFSDQSPLVRDSALGFIAKFLKLKPELEGEVCTSLIAISTDAAIGVRKHTIKLLKDIYLRNKSRDIRSEIADTILQRIDDNEESVCELARQTIEEIWLGPFYSSSESLSSSAQSRQDLLQHAILIVTTTQREGDVSSVLQSLFKKALTDNSKNQVANMRVCKALVAIMFDCIIDNETDSGMPAQHHILHTLTIFAKAEPQLFDGEQMKTLQPYIENVSTSDNFLTYRSVIVIFRCVLPVLPSLPITFLSTIQTRLLATVTRLGKSELNEVSMCLWTIDGVLKNTDRLVKLTLSLLNPIHAAKTKDMNAQPELLVKIGRIIRILGYFGKACNLESHIATYKQQFPWWKENSVSELMVEILLPFTSSNQPLELRRTAFESICLICQSWPKNFRRPHIIQTFEAVFENKNADLEQIILAGFKAFYDIEEQRSKFGTDTPTGEEDGETTTRLGKSMMSNDTDGASAYIAQKFLPQILRIALASSDSLALLATELIVSTSNQGLLNPRVCSPAIIALTTSPNKQIAKISAAEHQNLHRKHESMLEKQYLHAIEQTFEYQRDTVGDTSGIDLETLKPKLGVFFDILRSGTVQSRRKLYSNLCTRLNPDLTKLQTVTDLTAHLQYTKFVLQNLSLVDYGRVDELIHLTGCIEKIFVAAGTILSQRVEDYFQSEGDHNLAVQNGEQNSFALPAFPISSNLPELQSITIVSMILSLFWETRAHLRRTWNLFKYGSSSKVNKAAPKDLNKPPTKSATFDPRTILTRFEEISAALTSRETMEAQCRAFIDFLSTDNELKVSSEDDGQAANGYETPSEVDGENGSAPPSGASRGSKRRASVSVAGTPLKKKGKPSLGRKRTGGYDRDDDDDSEGGWD